MSKIFVLDKHVAELIAAGEVVERPASVVKELVENSIDAKATSISVEIRQGGTTYIRITDNGIGIDREDVPTAFLRHATSKVKNATDLDAISSLGFRGEALASISAVSHVELTTKTANSDNATKIVLHGGEIDEIIETGAPKGTTIIIKDIFYNIPARMKFLKKDVSEGNAVAAVLDKLALSHPEISFRFIREHKEVFFTSGDNKMLSAIYGVFGKEFTSGLIPVNYEYQGVKVYGFITKPGHSRASRAMQNFFINGRYIKTKTAMVALEEGMKHSIMVGKYPACVLHLDMDYSHYDVNVHPAKLDVRFINERPVFDAVYHAVKSTLLKEDKPKQHIINQAKKAPINPFAPVEKPEQIKLSEDRKNLSFNEPQRTIDIKPIIITYDKKIDIAPVPIKEEKVQIMLPKPNIDIVRDEVEIQQKSENSSHEVHSAPVKLENERASGEIKGFVKYSVDKAIAEMPLVKDIDEALEEMKTELAEHKLIGEVFNTYIIIEYKNSMMMIDKHAAHERLLYEKLKSNMTDNYEQTLLQPVTLLLDKPSYSALIENIEKLSDIGFSIDDFGMGTVIVRSAPLSLDGQDIESAITEISGYLLKNIKNLTTEHTDWIYHNVACRAAVKGGIKSDNAELIHLVKMLDENPELKYCPHGRPIYSVISKREIEKQFGRI